MRTAIIVILILAFGIVDADARRRKYRHYDSRAFFLERSMPPAYGARMRERGPPSAFDDRRRGGDGTAGLVPDGWQLQPTDPNWHGRRYLAPGGDAWIAFYAAPADLTALSVQMKIVAFAEGEEITYLRGERAWIAVSGLKGDRVFYRKAVLACGGTRWHQVALEYPQHMARGMDRYVTRISRAVDRPDREGCESSASTQPQQQP